MLHLGSRCYTGLMPTTKPRYSITEDAEIAEALAKGLQRWPELADRPALVLRRLIEEGAQSLDVERDARRHERARWLRQLSGVATGVYPPDYLEKLREEWPD